MGVNSKIYNMGPYKVLISFNMKKDMEKALSLGMELLLNFFDKVRRWEEME